MVSFRKWVADNSSPSFYAKAYMILSAVSPQRTGVFITKEDGVWKIDPGFDECPVYAPHPSFARRFDQTETDGFSHHQINRYTLGGEVEVEANDIVMDIGACIGEFAKYALKSAEQVIAVEPDSLSANCLLKNVQNSNSVSVVEKVAWKEEGEITFNISDDATESSVLGIDKGDLINTVQLPATTVESIANEFGVEKIDFLKIDAEGAEPEVLEGIRDLDIRKIAVDCTPERNGRSPQSQVDSWLNNHGFDTISRRYMIFGKVN